MKFCVEEKKQPRNCTHAPSKVDDYNMSYVSTASHCFVIIRDLVMFINLALSLKKL